MSGNVTHRVRPPSRARGEPDDSLSLQVSRLQTGERGARLCDSETCRQGNFKTRRTARYQWKILGYTFFNLCDQCHKRFELIYRSALANTPQPPAWKPIAIKAPKYRATGKGGMSRGSQRSGQTTWS